MGDDLRLDAKQVFEEVDRCLKMLQRLQVLHVADVLAEEGKIIAGETEGILEFGAGGQDLPGLKGQANGEWSIPPRPANGLGLAGNGSRAEPDRVVVAGIDVAVV